MLKCPKCNTIHSDNVKFCNVCGTSLVEKTKLICPTCGTEVINKSAKFCIACGQKFDDEHKPLERKIDYHRHICPKCGSLLQDNEAKFCNSCGNNFNENPSVIYWDTNKFYRLCTYCGTSHLLDENDVKFCKKCGHKLDLRPRTTDKLTSDEQKIVDERIAKEKAETEKKQKMEAERLAFEKRQLEEERQRQETAKKRQQVELARIKAEKKQKQKQLFKVISIIIVTCSALTLIGAGIWKFSEKSFISNGDKALAQGDYNTAISYYKKVFPIGSTHNMYEQKIATIAKAVTLYDEAKVQFNNNSYLNAMSKSKEALDTCSELIVAQDLYTQSQNKLGEYLQKLFDEKDYTQLYMTLSNIGDEYCNEITNDIAKSLEEVIQSYIDNGNTYLKSGNYAEAVTYANKALAINTDCSKAIEIKKNVADVYVEQGRKEFNAYHTDNALKLANDALALIESHQDAVKLKSEISDYNTYLGYLKDSYDYYVNANYSNAIQYADKVPTDTTAGKLAIGQYDTYLDKLNNDKKYYTEPVVITSKGVTVNKSNSYYKFDYSDSTTGYTDIVVTLCLANRLNRSVTTTIRIKISSGSYETTKYATYTLSDRETRSETVYINNFYSGSTNNYDYNITIDNTTIQK